MPVDVEKIIQFIKQGDQDNVQIHLDDYNAQNSKCFFFDVEEKERRKQRELDEFRRNKVREYIPDSDSDFDSDENEDQDLVLRRRLAAALIWFIRMRLQPGVLRVCLRTLRIISRDRKALAPLMTDYAILTLARLGGISSLPTWPEEEDAQWGSSHSDIPPENETETQPENNGSDTECPTCYDETDDSVCASAACAESSVTEGGWQFNPVNITSNCNTGRETQNEESIRKDGVCGVLTRGKRDARGERDEEGEEGHDDGEVWRKEALKTLCNVIYNSPKAQERASALKLLHGLSERLKEGIHSSSPPNGQFFELRLLFLLTALRPELRIELRKLYLSTRFGHKVMIENTILDLIQKNLYKLDLFRCLPPYPSTTHPSTSTNSQFLTLFVSL